MFSFEIVRLRIFVWNPSLVNFRLGNRAPEAGGTRLLRLGEPSSGSRGNHRRPSFLRRCLRHRVRTLLGKPSYGKNSFNENIVFFLVCCVFVPLSVAGLRHSWLGFFFLRKARLSVGVSGIPGRGLFFLSKTRHSVEAYGLYDRGLFLSYV